jgi:sulfotransferase family protein
MSAERGPGPIFIGGLAYSGKTRLRIALERHPALSLTRKTHLWDRFDGRFGDLSMDRNLDRCLAALVADPVVQRLQPDPDRIRGEFGTGPSGYARLFGLVHAHHAERHGARRWGEQLGSVERFADPIFAAFPDARMIHLIRDPRERFEASGPRSPGSVGWQTAMWRRSAELARRNTERYPEGYRVIRYETLAARPAETLEELCQFLGEECLPGMRASILESFGGDASTPARATSRAIRRSFARRAFVDRYAGPGLPAFDYPTRTTPRSARDLVSLAFVEWPIDRAVMAVWRITEGRSARMLVGGG